MFVRLAPLPEKVSAVTVPVNVGLSDFTKLPVPVVAVVPVPPFSTGITPEIWSAGTLVKPEALPVTFEL